MKDLLDEANKRDNERKIGTFSLVVIQGIWGFTICNN